MSGPIKTMERAGKRLIIAAVCKLVRTPKLSAEEVKRSKPRSVLVVRQHNQMGDMMLAVPAFRAIKDTYGPDVRVGVVTARINRDVLLNCPYVDRVLTYSNRDPRTLFRILREARRDRYDLLIVLHTVSFSFTSAAIGLLSRTRVRVGSTSRPFGHRIGEAFYHLELPLPTAGELATMSETEHNLYPLRAIGIDTTDLAPVIVPHRQSVAWANEFVRGVTAPGTVLIAVHPGAGKVENIWSVENFAEVVKRIARRHNLRLCVIEGPRDTEPVAAFRERVEIPLEVIHGRPIGDVAALMRGMDLVLCNDTGVMHVAAAAGARTLAVFGPTDPARWAPRSPNLHVVRGENGDLTRLTPEHVAERALVLLEEAKAVRNA